MVLEGVHLPKYGKTLVHLCPLSMISLQASKSHSSKAPKNESFPHATSFGHGSTTQTTPMQTETASPHTPELKTTSAQRVHPSSQADRLSTLIEGLYQRISGFEKFLYSTNNQVQMHLTAIKTQLNSIQQTLEDDL